MITHYQRLLDYVEPDRVHVLQEGRIVQSGDKSLALELERRGYGALRRGCLKRRGSSMNAVVDFPTRPETRPYVEAFRAPSGEPEWLSRQRRRNLARFAEQGFPSRRSEAWRYLDLRPLEQQPMLPAGGGAPPHIPPGDIALPALTYRLVLVDGRLAAGTVGAPRVAAGRRVQADGRGDRGCSPTCFVPSSNPPPPIPAPSPRSTRPSSPTASFSTSLPA